MAPQRMSFPYCGRNVAASSVRAHLGQRVCPGRMDPSLKARRITLAHQNKLTNDREYAHARCAAIQHLGTQLLGRAGVTEDRVIAAHAGVQPPASQEHDHTEWNTLADETPAPLLTTVAGVID
ncbi:hypothetical protein PF010_g4757 [Phytophthora fragariae]|uniref:Uncharacterized protein n=2 Tax=Phytophthora fragariae TaxID=53985 RepID=A0A6G0LQA9_9STRA|nr:hypothetical protein PF010_g4757 [Phytophthora fragariae]KAE9246994.1 hypothetical protein PF004_g4535 [Phytophthora fragariae]